MKSPFLFIWFDYFRPINNLSVIKGRVFLGWTSTKLELMFLLKDTTKWRWWGSNRLPLGLESSTLPLSHCPPRVQFCNFWFPIYSENGNFLGKHTFASIVRSWLIIPNSWNSITIISVPSTYFENSDLNPLMFFIYTINPYQFFAHRKWEIILVNLITKCHICENNQFHAQLSWVWKSFITSGPDFFF